MLPHVSQPRLNRRKPAKPAEPAKRAKIAEPTKPAEPVGPFDPTDPLNGITNTAFKYFRSDCEEAGIDFEEFFDELDAEDSDAEDDWMTSYEIIIGVSDFFRSVVILDYNLL